MLFAARLTHVTPIHGNQLHSIRKITKLRNSETSWGASLKLIDTKCENNINTAAEEFVSSENTTR